MPRRRCLVRSPCLPVLLAGMAVAACDPDPPPGMVRIEDEATVFWIDRHEFPGEEGGKPTTYVDLHEARQHCASAGKRLCAAAEWRRACLGPQGENRFGYGPRYQPDTCHVARDLPSGHTSMMDPRELVAASGAYPRCRTPEGVYDLVGNVEEWVLDDWNGAAGMLEGGAWYTHHTYADCTGRYSRQPDYRVDPDRRVFSAGFRCCWSEEAPREADLDPARIAEDARQRLREARERWRVGDGVGDGDRSYDPQREVEVQDGVWIDMFEYPNRPGVQPRTAVSWREARTLCRSAGKRLCEVQEWERACSGPQGWPWPFGHRYTPDACAVELTAPPPTGSHLACVSPSGARDMVGSVWEWTASSLDLPGLAREGESTLRELRGGSWFVDPVKARCGPVDGYPVASEEARFPDVGFRCCRGEPTVEPVEAVDPEIACPSGMVAVGELCIDTYEHPNREGTVPVGNMSYGEARTLCRARGLHLCTEAEWSLACAGRAGRRWPYGNTYVPDRCQDEAQARQDHSGGPAPSGANPDCRTPEGVYDLSGNLWEWVRTTEGRGVLAGGGWNISAGLGQCRARAHPAAGYEAAETGARCCGTRQEIERLAQEGS